ncbi:hypothetical protein B0T20DRAFT_448110 [Sordaria brevicollis]|uniref:Uncharacterized protein n=1 Tax=Sordaria brevicollis TaxID=83679 RepID=A0AAE0NVW0_SORBR|nr:hypothetical protein B0T20DRAFT_448110 [Sordaria brevicollis]
MPHPLPARPPTAPAAMVASQFSRHMCLFGFDHDTQARLVFDGKWATAFLKKEYTNEYHELVQRFNSDQHAKQELKYANNVCVLFKALLYCGRYWGQDSFWTAIASGFSTKPEYVEELTYMLMDARKIQRRRHVPRPHNSEVTRAVDEWMAFLDAYGPDLERALGDRTVHTVTDSDVYADADTFYKSMKGIHVNSNNIPLSVIGKPPCTRILAATETPYRPTPGGHRRRDLPPPPVSPPIKNEPRPVGTGYEYLLEPNRNTTGEPLRKRSGSPLSHDEDDYPPYKRHHGNSELDYEQHSPPRWYPEARAGLRQREDRSRYDEFERPPPRGPRSGDFWPPLEAHASQPRTEYERRRSHDEQLQKEEQMRRLEQENLELQKKVQEYEAQRKLDQQRLEQQRLDKELDDLQQARSKQSKAEKKKQLDAQKKIEQQRIEEQKKANEKKRKQEEEERKRIEAQKQLQLEEERQRKLEEQHSVANPGPRPSPHPSVRSSDEENLGLKETVAILEKKLADTEGQLKAAAVIRPLERSISKCQSDISSLRGEMSTLSDSFQVMVDKMALIQDDLISIKENVQSKQQGEGGVEELSISVRDIKEHVASVLSEISDLRLRHQQLEKKVIATTFRVVPSKDSEALKTALGDMSQRFDKLMNDVADLRKGQERQTPLSSPIMTDDIMNFLKIICDNVDFLIDEVADVKKEQSRMGATSDASENAAVPVDAELIKALFAEQKALIQSQNQKMSKMSNDISSLQAQVYASGRTQAQPKSLKNAMAAAEKDLQHHLITMKGYRDKMAERGNPSPNVVANMADMCQTLEELIQYSKAGQK